MAQTNTLPLNQLSNRQSLINFTGEVTLPIHRLELPRQNNRHHMPPVDSLGIHTDNERMPSLDVEHPGMPELQFVLFVSALCTADLTTINVSKELRQTIFDRCWRLLHTEPPPTNLQERVLDLREGTELTLEACASTIRSLLQEANISTLVWDHPVSDPRMNSTPEALPLIDRFERLYPDTSQHVDPSAPHQPGHNPDQV
jgi:hypothetical protein